MTAKAATKEFAVELDTKIAEKTAEATHLAQKMGQEQRVMNALYSSEATKERAAAKLEALRVQYDAVEDERAELNAQYEGWNRYWLVTNAGGHVHSSLGCSTCRWSTEFMWLTEFSGTSAKELVELAGERACTVCFPGAPVEKRSMLPYDVKSREEKAAADAEKAKKASEKMAKALLPDGSELKVKVPYGGSGSGGYVSAYAKTLVSARNEALRNLAHSLETYPGVDAEHDAHLKSLREAYGKLGMAFVKAIAEKTGQDLEALTAEFMAKAEKKARA